MQPYSSVWVYGSTVCLANTKTKWPLIIPWWRNQNAFLRQSMHKKSHMWRLWKMQAAQAVWCNVLPDSATFNLPNKQTRIVFLTAKKNVVGTFGVAYSAMPEQWSVAWKTQQCSRVKRSWVTMLHWTNSVVWLLGYIKAKKHVRWSCWRSFKWELRDWCSYWNRVIYISLLLCSVCEDILRQLVNMQLFWPLYKDCCFQPNCSHNFSLCLGFLHKVV